MPKNTNSSRKPPTGVWKLTLLVLARIGGRGRKLERWALRKLGVWAD